MIGPAPVGVPAADWLRAAALRDGARIYLDDRGSGRQLTFAQVETRVRQLSHWLQSNGVNPGDRIAIVASDCHGYIETLWASMRIGAVFVPLNVRLTDHELHGLLEISAPKVLFVSTEHVDRGTKLRAGMSAIEHLVCYQTGEAASAEDYERVLSGSPDADIRVRVSDDDPLGLAFTSGTTGLPKAVVQSQRMVKWTIIGCVLGWETRVEECYYSGAPLFHISGMAMVLMGALMNYTSVLMPGFDAAKVAAMLRDGTVTSAFLVPTMIGMVLEQPGAETCSYPKLRAIHYGAAPMPLALLKRALAVFNCDFVQSFGAGTESGWNCALTSADHRRAVAGAPHLLTSVGRAAPGVELRICDPDWQDVPHGEIGEVVIRSDMIMSGYLGQPEETANAMHPDGWFRAGDLGYQDEEGYLYLKDRKKDMIVRGGENIYPAEIERVLYQIPQVLECAVVRTPDAHWGEVPVAHIVLRAGGQQMSASELRNHCAEQLAKFKIPARWFFHDKLPKTASGKILKRELVGGRPEFSSSEAV
jgi:acyl-CoA synthetase (AMP-forming)/AMP-acid ligase II